MAASTSEHFERLYEEAINGGEAERLARAAIEPALEAQTERRINDIMYDGGEHIPGGGDVQALVPYYAYELASRAVAATT